MRTLDRYVVRSFLVALLLWLVVMVSLRAVTDLFVNMDEFAEKKQDFGQILRHVGSYYGYQSFAYFAQLGGVIMVAAAGFTIYRMNDTNELTAIMASGVSLRRVLWPIILCCAAGSGLVFLDRNVLLPRVASKLARDRGDVPGTKTFALRFMTDGQKTVWYSPTFFPAEGRMVDPMILPRDWEYRTLARISGDEALPGSLDGRAGWFVTGGKPAGAVLWPLGRGDMPWPSPPSTLRIWTELTPERIRDSLAEGGGQGGVEVRDLRGGLILILRAERFDPAGRMLIEPRFTFRTDKGNELGCFSADSASFGVDPETKTSAWLLEGGRLFYPSDLTVRDIKLRQSGEWMEYMSIGQLNSLLALQRLPDPRTAILTKHIRITEPLNNVLMLLIGVPFILSRRRNVKTSALRCLAMVGVFYCFIYISRQLPVNPVWAAWLPVLVFGPVAAVMLDTVKT